MVLTCITLSLWLVTRIADSTGEAAQISSQTRAQSTRACHAGAPARVQVQYPDALARMQQDLVNIRIAARFLQARPTSNLALLKQTMQQDLVNIHIAARFLQARPTLNLALLSLNSRGSALRRFPCLRATLSCPRVAGSAACAQPHRAPARRQTAAVRGPAAGHGAAV